MDTKSKNRLAIDVINKNPGKPVVILLNGSVTIVVMLIYIHIKQLNDYK